MRFVATVLVVSGVLCLVDVGVTMLWQEPISALIGTFGQGDLNRELADIPAPPPSNVLTPAQAERLANAYEDKLRQGHAFGTIVLPRPDRSYAVIEGVDVDSLREGPGHYNDPPVKTAIPGQGKTTGIAGHRTTYLAPFRHNDRLKPGDEIVLKMPYGTFTYAVQRLAAVPPDRTSVLKNVGYDRLVLTACHPPFSAAQRLITFAKLVRMEPAHRDEPLPTRPGSQPG
ncbi:MAG: sortase [Thermoleophilaceae bacterium]|nr:sortase [Thermoleophilaceae bacterium]